MSSLLCPAPNHPLMWAAAYLRVELTRRMIWVSRGLIARSRRGRTLKGLHCPEPSVLKALRPRLGRERPVRARDDVAEVALHPHAAAQARSVRPRVRARLVTLTLCVIELGCAATGTIANTDLHIGPVHYLNDTTTMLRTAGPPVQRRGPSAVAGGPLDIWRWDHFQCLLVTGWRCDQVSTTDSSLEVGPGLRVGMRLEELQRRLGAPAARRQSGDTTFVIYDLKGRGRGLGLSAGATRDTVRTLAVGQLTFVFM